MKLILIKILILTSSWSLAWEQQLIKRWDDSSFQYQQLIEGASFGTFWGGLRRGLGFYFPRGKMIEVLPDGFLKELPIFLDKRENKTDLYIFYPGVFGEPDGRISPQVIHEIEKKNVHLVVVPNLLAPSYLVSRPKVSGDLIYSEGVRQKKILKIIFSIIGEENIDRVHVLAESLGSFQALTAFSPDKAYTPKMDSLTLMWPPLDLGKAIKRFDKLIEQSVDEQKECTYWWKWPYYVYEIKFRLYPSGLSSDDKRCLGAWVIGTGFVSSIKKTAEYVYEQKFLETKQLPTTFLDFTTSVLPEFGPMITNSDQKLTVSSLLQWEESRRKKIRFISSKNDFLNGPEDWDELRKIYPEFSDKIYLFPWGGHSGPAGMDDFIKTILH